MGMPCSARSRLECDLGALHAIGGPGFEKRVDAQPAREPFGWTGARGRLSGAINLHDDLLRVRRRSRASDVRGILAHAAMPKPRNKSVGVFDTDGDSAGPVEHRHVAGDVPKDDDAGRRHTATAIIDNEMI